MAHAILSEVGTKLESSVEHLASEMRGLRSGRATPALVENIKADYYGNPTPIAQIAQIQIPEPRQIVIRPFDVSALAPMEKAIQASSLGINPQNDGKVLRLMIPMMSEEQRKKLVGRIKEMGEAARISLRNSRRDANKKVDAAKSASEVTEDEAKKLKEDIQSMLKEHETKVDELLKVKTTEIMED